MKRPGPQGTADKKEAKAVEGSADKDIREIEEADQIRMRTISTIQALLNL